MDPSYTYERVQQGLGLGLSDIDPNIRAFGPYVGSSQVSTIFLLRPHGR